MLLENMLENVLSSTVAAQHGWHSHIVGGG